MHSYQYIHMTNMACVINKRSFSHVVIQSWQPWRSRAQRRSQTENIRSIQLLPPQQPFFGALSVSSSTITKEGRPAFPDLALPPLMHFAASFWKISSRPLFNLAEVCMWIAP